MSAHPVTRETLTLRELGEEERALYALSAMDDGEWSDEAEALERDLAGRLALKADGYGSYVADQTARAAAIKEEEQRLAKRRKAIENRLARLKAYAAETLHFMGKTKVEGELYTLTVQATPPRAVLNDDVLPSNLPPGFVRVIPEKVEPNMAEILSALKDGAELPFARMERGLTLRVR